MAWLCSFLLSLVSRWRREKERNNDVGEGNTENVLLPQRHTGSCERVRTSLKTKDYPSFSLTGVHLCGRFTTTTGFLIEVTLRIPRLKTQRERCCLSHKNSTSLPLLWCRQTKRKRWLNLFIQGCVASLFYLSPLLSALRIKRSSGWPSWFRGRTTSRCCSRCSGTRDTRWKSRHATSRACQSPPTISSSCHRNLTSQVKLVVVIWFNPLFSFWWGGSTALWQRF